MWIAATDPFLDVLSKAGPAGVVILGFVTGYLWAKPAVERLQHDLDQALADLREIRREYRELDASFRETIVPAVTRFIELYERLQERRNGGM